jgi:hypothetical protein
MLPTNRPDCECNGGIAPSGNQRLYTQPPHKIPTRQRIMCVCQRNEQKPIKHSEKLIDSRRSRPTVHRRIRGRNHARTSTKPLCGSSKRLLRSIKL